jgi:predicted DNA-binding transcriptional regulator AlpA
MDESNAVPPIRKGHSRLPAVMERFSVSASTIYAEMKAGRFPRPKLFGKKIALWDDAELDEVEKNMPRSSGWSDARKPLHIGRPKKSAEPTPKPVKRKLQPRQPR